MSRAWEVSERVVAAMLDPGFYPEPPARVELRETHASWVFLAGDLAYKVKKPVVLPFLDYGTVERRREMCEEEVRLNRRLAPAYYLGVDSVVADGEGLRLVAGIEPSAIEYVVRMRRVPEERTLEGLIARGTLSEPQIDAVAERIAGFHLAADTAPPEASVGDRLIEPLEENLRTLREVGPPLLAEDRLIAAERFTAAFLAARRDRIETRAGAGLVRDCHGDLRAEHVILAGGIEVYDCVEFNRSLRLIDVGADLAFLVMDLCRLDREDLARRIIASYRRAGGDPGDDALVWFYATYRAWVRAKVTCLRARELTGTEKRDAVAGEARHLMALGHRLAWRARMPLVIAICGAPASGKTRLAEALAAASGLEHLNSDVVRKRLAGVAPLERAAPKHYTREFTTRTYQELGSSARSLVERVGGAIVDATFHRAEEREAFRAGLGTTAAAVLFAECQAPPGVLLERARARVAAGPGVSDADAAIAERHLAEREPLDEVAAARHAAIDAEAPVEDQVVDVERLADRRFADP